MPKISANGSTLKQTAYARRIWSADGENRKHIALDVGYSPSIADSPKQKIESTKGFNNAMTKLAMESNNLALKIMHEFAHRDLKQFSNKDLIGSLNAIGNAWAKFSGDSMKVRGQGNTDDKNKLRAVFMQRVENQTINNPPATIETQVVHESSPIAGINTDF